MSNEKATRFVDNFEMKLENINDARNEDVLFNKEISYL